MGPTDRTAEARRLFFDALALQERGELEHAASLYQEALALAPERPSVMNNLATVFIGLKRFAEARVLCGRLVERDPADDIALLNLGTCQLELGSAAEALDSFEAALRLKPDFADALSNRGNALLALERPQEALASYDRALAIRSDFADALYNRGNALLALKRLQEALASYDRALAIQSGHADALYNRGNTLSKLGRPEDALASFDRALAIRPRHVGVLNNRGIALQNLNRREELIANYRQLLDVAPEHPYIHGFLLNARLHCCDWSGYDDGVAQITERVRAGKRADAPFNFLAISDSAADQLRCAQICVADEHPEASNAMWRGERYRHGKIRLAYVSADLHGHAMSYLLAGLYEAHDRTRFETTAISLGPNRNDAMRARLKAAFDRFIDAHGDDDRKVASLLRELEIDIAIDLQGYTWGCRPGIFAHRAAPVQVNYLGYPGTMGSRYLDYLIGDRWVIPPEQQSCYSEKVVYLPDSYQANDDKRRIALRTPPRAELGLPEQAFVFCCFNNNYKIAPSVFDIWMRLLDRVEGSVLWLLEDNKAASRNLREEARRRGVAAERLVFAPRVDMEDHLARQRQANLFLDTLPYNAHVTASDALWVGLPVVTRLGTAFAGRVAASLLNAVGLGDLVTSTREEYEQLAFRLATDRALLEEFRTRLSRNRSAYPLFDTDRFRRHIEAAYSTMWERYQRAEPPTGFAVPALRQGDER